MMRERRQEGHYCFEIAIIKLQCVSLNEQMNPDFPSEPDAKIGQLLFDMSRASVHAKCHFSGTLLGHQ